MTSENTFRIDSPRDDDCALLKALLKDTSAFVSGSELAKMLNVSTPGVWGKLKKLQAAGFEIEAVRSRGYRLLAQPNALHPALLKLEAEAHAVEMDCLYFPVIDSTNNEAERQIANGRAGPFAILSSCQTKGRGRLGREWFSASAENLYLTVTFEPRLPAKQLQHFTLWCGIHLCQSFRKLLPKANLQIKWPNDLFCEGRKFAGMLTEAKLDSDGLKTLFFGLGLNLNSNPNAFPKEIRNRATSLQAISGEALPINRTAILALKAVQAAYHTSIENSRNSTQSLTEAWASLDCLEGRKVTAEFEGRTLSGIANGIDSTGALLLDIENGSEVAICSGDVSLTQY